MDGGYKIPLGIPRRDDPQQLTDEVVHHITEKDNRTYVISFSCYKKKKCEVRDLESSAAKKALTWMREYGLASSQDEIECSFKTKPISNNNHYAELFHGLSQDVEMKEVVLGSSARLFFYIDEAFKVIHCVLMKNSHYEDDKKKR